jgi:hypothetical protein
MSAGLLFWILMIFAVFWGFYLLMSFAVFWGFYSNWPNWKAGGFNLLLFLLLALLGWKVFGPAIHG